jgi:hypothetical protein
MTAKTVRRCPVLDPVWDRRCVKVPGHDDVHRNDEIPGDTLTWGTIAQVRAYERSKDMP